MTEYQRIEYRISKDGTVTEVVLNGTGTSCTTTTADVEQALGQVESQNLLPEYYAGEEILPSDEFISLQQQ